MWRGHGSPEAGRVCRTVHYIQHRTSDPRRLGSFVLEAEGWRGVPDRGRGAARQRAAGRGRPGPSGGRMTSVVRLFRNTYVDSVRQLGSTRAMRQIEGVEWAAA